MVLLEIEAQSLDSKVDIPARPVPGSGLKLGEIDYHAMITF